ncbi:hypothetical protein D3C85_1533430 [compost metagenome]
MGRGGATGQTDLAKARQGLVHQRRELAKGGHQCRAIEGNQAGLGVDAEQQGRHIGVTDDDLGILSQPLVVHIGQQGV